MGVVRSERGALKLIHPGRYVEIHRKPISAAEVMYKHPRHSITRPDVFEYPWIVVRPESVLDLGKVYFVVPNHTIYDLLQKRMSEHQHSLQIQSAKGHLTRHHNQKVTSHAKSFVNTTPKHHEHSQFYKQKLQTMFSGEAREQDNYSKRCTNRKQLQVGYRDELTTKDEVMDMKFEEDSETGIRPFNAKEYYLTDSDISKKFRKRIAVDERQLVNNNREITVLKSCLRKEGSVHKSRQFRVSFALPEKDKELKKKLTEC